jgi:hypothetical protein
MKSRINVLDKEIRAFFCNAKYKRVRQAIVPGNSGSLWKVVKVANDANIHQLPNILFLNNVEIGGGEISEVFAKHFDTKIRDILGTVTVDDTVYNGIRKINSKNWNFMTREVINQCLLSLNCKNLEGFDRIPQRILLDGAEILIDPLCVLFDKIYHQKFVPEQWLVAGSQ